MAKLKFDKESLQSFFFNHTEKIVLAVVLVLLGLFIWTGSSLEGIGAQNPAELASKVEQVAKKIEVSSWDNIKKKHDLKLDHVVRKEIGDATTSESYYRLDTPLIGGAPNSVTPRQDPEIFSVTDLEATVVTAALPFTPREGLTDPFADLENMQQKKVEAPKKKKKKKKKTGTPGYGPGMEMYSGEGSEEEEESMYAPDMYGAMGSEMAGGAAGPAVRADADKFHGYRPNATITASGSSVIPRSIHVVSVKALVHCQQQWDEFERVFTDAAGYLPSRDSPRYIAFKAEKAEVPSDPSKPLEWKLFTNTAHSLLMIPRYGFAGYPGELADSKYVLPGVLTMPVPPVMMQDLRGLALHSKVPLQEEIKADTAVRTGPELVDISEPGSVPDVEPITGAPSPRAGTGPMGSEMYGGAGTYNPMGEGGYGGQGGDGGYGEGAMYNGMGAQIALGPQAEFLMVRFFDFYVVPGKKYVYRIQLVLEDPNHPQNPQTPQPQDRNLADTVRARLAKVAADEAKQSAAKKMEVRISMLTSEWSEPTEPVSVELKSETYAGGVTLPRTPFDGEPAAEVMDLTWNPKYAVHVPGIIKAPRGAFFGKPIEAHLIDPVSLTYKTIPNYPLSSGELVVDLRGGEVLEAKAGDAQPLLTPGEVAVIDAAGNFIVRNELDDWQIFDKYAPPPPIVVEASPAAGESDALMGAGDYNPYSSP